MALSLNHLLIEEAHGESREGEIEEDRSDIEFKHSILTSKSIKETLMLFT